jgi:hypothetical protein
LTVAETYKTAGRVIFVKFEDKSEQGAVAT